MTTIYIDASEYEDHDDPPGAAAEAVADDYDLQGWDLSARWTDEQCTQIALDLPDDEAAQFVDDRAELAAAYRELHDGES